MLSIIEISQNFIIFKILRRTEVKFQQMQQTSLNLFKAFNSGGSCFGGGSSGKAVRNSVELTATYFLLHKKIFKKILNIRNSVTNDLTFMLL